MYAFLDEVLDLSFKTLLKPFPTKTVSEFSEPNLQIRDSVDCQSNIDNYHCEINSYIEFFHQESLQVRTKFQGQFDKF